MSRDQLIPTIRSKGMKLRMQKVLCCIVTIGCLVGCTSPGTGGAEKKAQQVLQIRWQRLLDEKGNTCDRCYMTEKTVEDGVKQLRRSLKGMNIDVVLVKTNVSPTAFAKDPLESNRIWIGEKPLEEWLQAKAGKSQCSGACGTSECRTLIVDGQTYESVPSALFVKAGLLAGANLIQTQSQPANPWDPTAAWKQGPSGCCPITLGEPTK